MPADGRSTSAAPVAGWRQRLPVLPRPCVLCSQWCTAGFCSDCHARFLAPVVPRCPLCALPGASDQPCGNCLRQPPPFSHCITLADYGFPWDRLVTRLKFQQQPELAGLLAAALSAALDRQPRRPRPHGLLPVPLSRQRLAERGYNQAWELARHLAPRQGCAAQAGWLLRLRDTPHQVGLGRAAREANLRDAMWVPPEGRRGIAGCQLALVDDVMTTCATAAAAAQVLLDAGAAGVQVWVLARTPPPGD